MAIVSDILPEFFVVEPMDWEDCIQAEEPMDWEYVHYLQLEDDVMEWEESPPQVCTLFVPTVGEPLQNVSPVPSDVSECPESKVLEPLKTESPIADPGVREISKSKVSEQVSTVLETTPRVQRKEVSSELPEITRRKVRRPPKVSSPPPGPRVILKAVRPQM
ncbi:hypothetical protein NPIL_665151 [Nephila pilipes]|uniref:Uncharacterized protein n=1 Tax=Nephila pilipes TaxID=299642 RepID=A0A8X6ULC0_NEPPI|nr:hypothetical protein NPIL_665151 [Nephila pilipes]